MEFSRLGNVLLLVDFNARTSDRQVGLLDFDDDSIIVPKLEAAELGISRQSNDADAPVTRYGHHLLELGAVHDLIIYNGSLSFLFILYYNWHHTKPTGSPCMQPCLHVHFDHALDYVYGSRLIRGLIH